MGLSFVARSDCMGNAKASKSGTSYGKKLPAFLYVCGKREDTINNGCSVGESSRTALNKDYDIVSYHCSDSCNSLVCKGL